MACAVRRAAHLGLGRLRAQLRGMLGNQRYRTVSEGLGPRCWTPAHYKALEGSSRGRVLFALFPYEHRNSSYEQICSHDELKATVRVKNNWPKHLFRILTDFSHNL